MIAVRELSVELKGTESPKACDLCLPVVSDDNGRTVNPPGGLSVGEALYQALYIFIGRTCWEEGWVQVCARSSETR